jgi:ankyrin repeat protein
MWINMSVSKELIGRFFNAAESGDGQTLLTLMEANPELLNQRNQDNQNALFSAIYGGDLECVKILVEQGIDVSSADNREWTPLHEATYNGTIEMVRLLLTRNVDLNARDDYGMTPLYWPCVDGWEECVKVLLDHGADPFVKDNHGRDCFDWAKQNTNSKTVKKLARLLRQYSNPG